MKWHVYILKCEDGSLYTGITTDLKRRFKQHKDGKGGNYTRSHGAKKILYSEKLNSRSKALKREVFIKRLKKEKKRALINGRD